MATMIEGETYLGKVLIRPLSENGDITLYCWPLRCLNGKFGGPTFGVDAKGEEMIRFDPHGERGHYHEGGYDKLGAQGSHVDFPRDVRDIQGQVAWSLDHLHNHISHLLLEAGYNNPVTPHLVSEAVEAVRVHLKEQGDLRTGAIRDGLLTA